MSEETNFEPSNEPVPSERRSQSWLIGVAVVLLCAVIISLGYVARESKDARQLAERNDQLNATLAQTRSQMDMLAAKLNELRAATPPAATETTESTAPATRHESREATVVHHRRSARATHAKRTSAEDPRWKQMQAQLAEHEKQIQANQENLQKTRDDLQGSLNSTRDELNGSIAKTHDELVALEKKGERNYYEFDLTKSKEFQHAGPVSLSLRKADTKHQRYDAVVLLDDYRLDKKHVNLYEPVLFYPEGSHQPIELVVNKIEKNRVAGYVSEPKYRATPSTAASAAGQETVTPAAASASAGDSNPSGASGAEVTLAHRPSQ